VCGEIRGLGIIVAPDLRRCDVYVGAAPGKLRTDPRTPELIYHRGGRLFPSEV